MSEPLDLSYQHHEQSFLNRNNNQRRPLVNVRPSQQRESAMIIHQTNKNAIGNSNSNNGIQSPTNVGSTINTNHYIRSHAFISNGEENVLDRVPANIHNAELHALAKRVAKRDENRNEVCECCGYHIVNEKLGFFCETLDLSFLGAGIPLYFGFTKACMVLFFVSSLIYTTYGMIANVSGDYCIEAYDASVVNDNVCILNWFNKFSLINRANDSDSLNEQNIVNLITVVVNVIVLHLYRRQMRIQEDLLDFNLASPSDFTVQLHNMPPKFKQENVSRLLNEWWNRQPPSVRSKVGTFGIEKICIAYDVTEYMSKMEQRHQINLQLRKNNAQMLSNNGVYPKGESMQSLLNKKKLVQSQLDTLEEQVFNGKYDQTTPHCFVTFNTRRVMECLLESQRLSYFQKILLPMRKCLGSKMNELLKMSRPDGRINIITVSRAPEPSDVNWQNCSATQKQKLLRRCMTWFATLVLLGICFFLIYLVSQWKYDVKNENKNQNNDYFVKTYLFLQSLFQSFLITFINLCLKITIKFLSNLEHQSTVTALNISIAEKLTIAQFCNSALITMIVNFSINNSNIWGTGGITNDFTLIALLNCVIPPFASFFNPWVLIRMYMRYKIRKNNASGIYCQGDANRWFEGNPLQLSVYYASTIKTLLMMAFYAPLSPYVLVIGLVGLLISYAMDKYLLLNRNARPDLIGSDLNINMIELAEFYPFSMAIGNLIWMRKIGYSSLALQIIAIGISAINFIIPSAKLNKMIFPIEDLDDSLKLGTYAQNKHAFSNDYDRCNPITQEEALKTHLNQLQKQDQQPRITRTRDPSVTVRVNPAPQRLVPFNSTQQAEPTYANNQLNQNPQTRSEQVLSPKSNRNSQSQIPTPINQQRNNQSPMTNLKRLPINQTPTPQQRHMQQSPSRSQFPQSNQRPPATPIHQRQNPSPKNSPSSQAFAWNQPQQNSNSHQQEQQQQNQQQQTYLQPRKYQQISKNETTTSYPGGGYLEESNNSVDTFDHANVMRNGFTPRTIGSNMSSNKIEQPHGYHTNQSQQKQQQQQQQHPNYQQQQLNKKKVSAYDAYGY